MHLARTFAPLLSIVWASPASAVGFVIGMLCLASGGVGARRGRVLEFYGGAAAWICRSMPIEGGAAAMTLGHTVIGQTQADLDRSREHELVHVRQYERWGPLFLPVYGGFSLMLWLRGQDPYYDNPFEREAYGTTD